MITWSLYTNVDWLVARWRPQLNFLLAEQGARIAAWASGLSANKHVSSKMANGGVYTWDSTLRQPGGMCRDTAERNAASNWINSHETVTYIERTFDIKSKYMYNNISQIWKNCHFYWNIGLFWFFVKRFFFPNLESVLYKLCFYTWIPSIAEFHCPENATFSDHIDYFTR